MVRRVILVGDRLGAVVDQENERQGETDQAEKAKQKADHDGAIGG